MLYFFTKIIGKGCNFGNRLYKLEYLSIYNFNTNNSLIVLAMKDIQFLSLETSSKTIDSLTYLWYLCLDHLNYKSLKYLETHHLVLGPLFFLHKLEHIVIAIKEKNQTSNL